MHKKIDALANTSSSGIFQFSKCNEWQWNVIFYSNKKKQGFSPTKKQILIISMIICLVTFELWIHPESDISIMTKKKKIINLITLEATE